MTRHFLAALALVTLTGPTAAACLPEPDPSRPQFVVGYGSLMEEDSKRRSAPDAGPNHPVTVTGFRRAWNTRGRSTGHAPTYLGVEMPSGDGPVPEMLAVVYKASGDLAGTDDREAFYCRHPVPPAQIEMLDGWSLPRDAQVWIYVNTPEAIHPPSAHWPIVQSYVDIFLSGCLDLQSRLTPDHAARMNVAERCIDTTHGWSEHWVNDRIMPRRAFIHQPNASEIDRLLAELLPSIFRRIEIE
ncbi:hypothetical protein [Roseovarius sp. D22-M7]|uniref:hypothetical protein n=1 Tax=Roseovarius sp. D22-M7 TaxID=3127116 RepID=UPI0030104F3E